MRGISRCRKVVAILENLKGTEKNYPPELMQARREVFAIQALSTALTTNTIVDNNSKENSIINQLLLPKNNLKGRINLAVRVSLRKVSE